MCCSYPASGFSVALITGLAIAASQPFTASFALSTESPPTSRVTRPNAIALAEKPLTREEEKNLLIYWVQLCQTYQRAGQFEAALNACEEALKLNRSDASIWATRSQLLAKLGKTPEAIATIDLALRLQGKNSQILTQKCALQVQTNQAQEAIATCEQALTLNRNWGDSSPIMALHYQAAALTKLGKLPEALNAYNALLAKDPTSQVWLGRCMTMFAIGNYREAAGDCNRALTVNRDWGDSTPAQAQAYRGRSLSQLGQYDAAISTCKTTPINRVTTAPRLLDQCAAITRQDEYQSALASYNQTLAVNPKDVDAWTQQGIVLAKLGRHPEALTSFDWALKLSPNYVLALAHRCAAFNKMNRYADALSSCDQALAGENRGEETNPALVWSQRGVALAGQGKYEEALSSLDRAQVVTPNNAEVWNNRGVVLFLMKNYKDAIAAFDQALTLNPNYAQAKFNKGKVYQELNQNQEALLAYDQALQGESSLGDASSVADVWTNKSVVLWQMQRFNDAVVAAQMAIRLNPKSVVAWYNQGVALTSQNQLESALQAYQKATQLNPGNAAIWLSQGIVLRRLKQYSTAIAALDQALALNPQLVAAWYHKGLTLTALKQDDAALQAYDAAIQLDTNHADALAQKGWVLLRRGDLAAAIQSFDAALKVQTNHAIAREGKASAIRQKTHPLRSPTPSTQQPNENSIQIPPDHRL